MDLKKYTKEMAIRYPFKVKTTKIRLFLEM